MKSENARGALFMIGGQIGFTVNDTFMKSLSGDVPFFQAMFLRGLAASVLFFLIALWMRQLSFKLAPKDRVRMAVRTLGETLAAYFFVSALFNMPIANAIAILQVLPLAVALGAYLFLGEPLGWRRLAAIFVGFVGVILIIRPGFEGFTVWSLYALAAVAAVTVRDLATRRMTSSLPSLTVAFAGSLGVTAFMGIGALFSDWAPVQPQSAALLSGAVLALMAAYFLSVLVMRTGEIAFVAPFRYTSLIAGLVLGYFVFDEWPDGLTMIGAAIVVATGLYSLWRENVVRRDNAS